MNQTKTAKLVFSFFLLGLIIALAGCTQNQSDLFRGYLEKLDQNKDDQNNVYVQIGDENIRIHIERGQDGEPGQAFPGTANSSGNGTATGGAGGSGGTSGAGGSATGGSAMPGSSGQGYSITVTNENSN